MNDYRGVHKAPHNNGYNVPFHDLAAIFGDDVYEHPEDHHGGDDPAIVRLITEARGKPDHPVTIWRAMPVAAGGWFNPGDWVGTSLGYVRTHAIGHDDGPEHERDMPVYELTVPARLVWANADSLVEVGYDGPATRGTLVQQQPTPPQAMNAHEVARYVYNLDAATDWQTSPDGIETVDFGPDRRVCIGYTNGGITWTWYVGEEDVTTDGWDAAGEDAGFAYLRRFAAEYTI